MGAVIEIRDYGHPRGLRVSYAAAPCSEGHRISLTHSYRQAARFAADQVEEEVQFWRELLHDPNVDVAVVD